MLQIEYSLTSISRSGYIHCGTSIQWNKKKPTTTAHNNMNESQKHHAKSSQTVKAVSCTNRFI